MNKYLYKLQRKMKWFAIPNLMLYVVVGMGTVYLCGMFFPDINITSYLSLVPSLVAQGQVWRLITFIFIPLNNNVMFVLLTLYFYYSIGRELENEWGSFGFTLFYFIGVVGSILASLLTGGTDNTFLNLSLFFAFAILFPDTQFLLFFIIPVKAKYLAIIDALLFMQALVFGSWAQRGAIVASLLNLLIFFGGDIIRRIRNRRFYSETQRNFRREMDRNNNNRY